MSLIELEQIHIQPLTRAEKRQLIKDIRKMLQQEEEKEEERQLSKIFKPGAEYEVATYSLAPDDTDTKAAAQLRELLEGHSA